MSHINVGVVQYRAEQNPRNNASEYPDMQIFSSFSSSLSRYRLEDVGGKRKPPVTLSAPDVDPRRVEVYEPAFGVV